MKEINFYFRKKEYGWLSNFHRCKQYIGTCDYPTNEHYYQSEKAKDWEIGRWIKDAPTPYFAMIAGRSLRKHELVDNWDEIRSGIMLTGLQAKFKTPELRNKLLATGDAVLHEDSPTDMFWGKRGKDMLGKLLMQVRKEITTCKCGKPGKLQYDNGLSCGVHCDECFEKMVSDCRKRSW